MRPAVTTKADFYRRFVNGEFGNRVQQWASYEAWEASGFTGLVGIRCKVAGGRFDPFVAPSQVLDRVREFRKQVIRKSTLAKC